MLLYQIVHVESGRKYIGQTSRPPIKRWREHLYPLRHGKHRNRFLQYAWDKHGEAAFKFEIIQEFRTLEELNAAEVEMIANMPNLYDLADGGHNRQHTQKAKIAIGEANKRPVVGMCVKTGEIREYGCVTDTSKDGFYPRNIGGACRLSKYESTSRSHSKLSSSGWVWMYKSEFSLDKMKERQEKARRGKIRKERPVLGLSLCSQEIKSFISITDAYKAGFNITTVRRACLGEIKAHKGLVWVYADSPNSQSLLQEKKKAYLNNPPKRGPKSWQ